MRFLIVASVAVFFTGACARPPTIASLPQRPEVAPVCLQAATAATGPERLQELRSEIDCADRALARLVGERLEIARRIGAIKRTMGAPVVDTVREAAVTERFVELARVERVPEQTARTLIRTLIAAARAQQE